MISNILVYGFDCIVLLIGVVNFGMVGVVLGVFLWSKCLKICLIFGFVFVLILFVGVIEFIVYGIVILLKKLFVVVCIGVVVGGVVMGFV